MSCRIFQRLYFHKPLVGLKFARSYAKNVPRYILNMKEAFVHYDRKADTFDFTFRYTNETLRIDRQFNFTRKLSETVESFLRRVESNVGKVLHGKQRRINNKKAKLGSEEGSNSMDTKSNDLKETFALLRNHNPVDKDLSLKTLFESKERLDFLVEDTVYNVKLNSPWITSISMPKSVLQGFPIYPTKFEAIFTERSLSEFRWYSNSTASPKAWQEVGNGYFYVPRMSDMGCTLKVTCIPKNEHDSGPLVEATCGTSVEAGPGTCPFENRHLYTQRKLSGKSFRVLSYNILADSYTDSDYSRDVLFPYCPTYALDIDYRKQLIIKEIIGFNSDIVCLQEVDGKIYANDYTAILSTLNYASEFNPKGGNNSEGLATFYNTERFEKLQFDFTILGEKIDLPGFHEVWERITNENAKKRFLNRGTAVQVTLLRSKKNRLEILVVGNTHLYFHPNADHIRLLQGYYVLMYVRNAAKTIKEKFPDCNVNILLCGDFNSVPECGIYQLMTKKYVSDKCVDWNSFPEESVENISLSQDLNFASACGTPEYTNYTVLFSGCLDYIYYQTDRLKLEQSIPMPTTEELKAHTAIPSVVFPSDHISLCADFSWTT